MWIVDENMLGILVLMVEKYFQYGFLPAPSLTKLLFFESHFVLFVVTVLLDEMVMNGYIVETNKGNILRPLDLMERESQKAESMYR